MLRFIVVCAVICMVPCCTTGQEVVDDWRFVLKRPAKGWQATDFDDSRWRKGPGGFGLRSTPGARMGTHWTTKNIWLRKTFPLPNVPENPGLLMHHDEDAEVYINGQLASSHKGYTTKYTVIPLGAKAKSLLVSGENTLAVHCRQTVGGQFIDVHVVDVENVPELPPGKRNTKPFATELITRWGEEVSAEGAWREYPRPQLVRPNWRNLNGLWDYTITSVKQHAIPEKWSAKILVPFCLESRLSGVGRLLEADEALWYRRQIDGPSRPERRTLLNFEAVDYRCEVFVNGQSVGKHQGGNTPFSFDITEALNRGKNELVVRVEDETEGWQLRGKQVLHARGIWYTQVSGIWQSVWTEEVADSYIQSLKIATDIKPEPDGAKTGIVDIKLNVINRPPRSRLRLVMRDGDTLLIDELVRDAKFDLQIPYAKLWSPDSPHLYDFEFELVDADGKPIDRVKTYAAIRTVGKERDQDGHLRFTLNGEPIFHLGPLDQGWWPDGLLTPPSDEAMQFDIRFLKEAGFNMIRKHIKVEPRRYYYHCDRLGMMLWQDHVSAGHNPKWTRLKPDPQDADWPDQHHQQFMLELERMIDSLENHPSIVCWVPFNEAWGQHRTMEVGKWISQRDSSRLINIASGGNFWPIGDIVDHHNYPHPDFPFDAERYRDFIRVIGEFGGHGYPVKGHLWDASRDNWGYGGLPKDEAEYKQRYVKSMQLLSDFRERGIAGGIYTQTTDVEGEINGLMTYDRKVIKIPAKELAELHAPFYAP